MKTPERWRPSRFVPSLSVFSPHYKPGWRHIMTSYDVVMSWRDVTWRCEVIVWHQITYYVMKVNESRPTYKKLREIMFFSRWRPWPSNLSEMSSRYTPPPNFRSVPQAIQLGECWQTNTHTDAQTHRQDRFYTLDRWRGRELVLSV